jgi:hypothetical protein
VPVRGPGGRRCELQESVGALASAQSPGRCKNGLHSQFTTSCATHLVPGWTRYVAVTCSSTWIGQRQLLETFHFALRPASPSTRARMWIRRAPRWRAGPAAAAWHSYRWSTHLNASCSRVRWCMPTKHRWPCWTRGAGKTKRTYAGLTREAPSMLASCGPAGVRIGLPPRLPEPSARGLLEALRAASESRSGQF